MGWEHWEHEHKKPAKRPEFCIESLGTALIVKSSLTWTFYSVLRRLKVVLNKDTFSKAIFSVSKTNTLKPGEDLGSGPLKNIQASSGVLSLFHVAGPRTNGFCGFVTFRMPVLGIIREDRRHPWPNG